MSRDATAKEAQQLSKALELSLRFHPDGAIVCVTVGTGVATKIKSVFAQAREAALPHELGPNEFLTACLVHGLDHRDRRLKNAARRAHRKKPTRRRTDFLRGKLEELERGDVSPVLDWLRMTVADREARLAMEGA